MRQKCWAKATLGQVMFETRQQWLCSFPLKPSRDTLSDNLIWSCRLRCCCHFCYKLRCCRTNRQHYDNTNPVGRIISPCETLKGLCGIWREMTRGEEGGHLTWRKTRLRLYEDLLRIRRGRTRLCSTWEDFFITTEKPVRPCFESKAHFRGSWLSTAMISLTLWN